MTETEQILTAILDCRRIDLYTAQPVLSPAQEELYKTMQQRRRDGEPLQYILGRCEFMGLPFFVNEHVLIPRPETEILIETVLEKAREWGKESLSVLELGTGSGNIAVSLAKFLPEAYVTTVDCSSDALKVAVRNAHLNSVEHRIRFMENDMFGFCRENHKKFDIIVSNPPYIRTRDLASLPVDVRQEPRLALDGGTDGLSFLRFIIETAPPRLSTGGFIALEIGDGQEQAIKHISDFKRMEFFKDYVGTDRVVVLTDNHL